MANALKTIYEAICRAVSAKEMPEKLSENKDRYDAYAYDPYIKNESVTETIEKNQGGKISLNKSEDEVEVGKFITLTATVSPKAIGSVTWSSSDVNVATVDNGTVTGVAEGSATITAKVDKLTAKCVVTVNAAVVEEEPKEELEEPDSDGSGQSVTEE